MKSVGFLKEHIGIIFTAILSAVLNFGNIAIEGFGNAYYAAAARSMTMSLKNFFFVSFDPAGFITIDKPPLGYWFQAVSAKIFGFYGWSIILPQALAGVITVVFIYRFVKRSFGKAAGLISALILSVTPVFVAASRNNTVDNVLVLTLILACQALLAGTEKGKLRYIMFSMVLVGLGFNIKMLQAYMIIPAIYVTYLLSTAASFWKRILHLIAGTFILITVSLSWALIVDSIPAANRPYVDSSTNNTVMELILGHNGAKRLNIGNIFNFGKKAPGLNPQVPQQPNNGVPAERMPYNGLPGYRVGTAPPSPQNNPGQDNPGSNLQRSPNGYVQARPYGAMQDPPSGAPNGAALNRPGSIQNRPAGDMPDNPANGNLQGNPGNGNLQGAFGGQLKSGITRLFSKNILSDQIAWFIILALFGFAAGAVRENFIYKLDNSRKQSLILWLMWFMPGFIYFSYNKGLFHSYYLTMLAPPAAALTGIGVSTMWEFYKEGGWKSWFLPVSLLANGVVQMLLQSYFLTTSGIVKILMIILIVLCFGSVLILAVLNFIKLKENYAGLVVYFKKILVVLAVTGLLATPFTGSAAVLFKSVGGGLPAAGLELLSANRPQGQPNRAQQRTPLIDFLLKNKTASQKYLVVVTSSNEAADIIIKTGEPVMAIGGFSGNVNSITLDQFVELVIKGEVRYVMTGSNRGGRTANTIMNWVLQNGSPVAVPEGVNAGRTPGIGLGQLYDLKSYTDK